MFSRTDVSQRSGMAIDIVHATEQDYVLTFPFVDWLRPSCPDSKASMAHDRRRRQNYGGSWKNKEMGVKNWKNLQYNIVDRRHTARARRGDGLTTLSSRYKKNNPGLGHSVRKKTASWLASQSKLAWQKDMIWSAYTVASNLSDPYATTM